MRPKNGYTFVELLVVLVLGGILLTGIIASFTWLMNSSSTQRNIAGLQADILTVSKMIEQDVRSAGYGVPGNGIAYLSADTSSQYIIILVNNSNSSAVLTKSAYEEEDIIFVDNILNHKILL